MNDDALFETRRCLIHARLPTRIFNNIYSEPPASPPTHHHRMPAVQELKVLPTKTTSPSTTRTKRRPFETQHSAMNASNYSRTTKSGTAPCMGAVASATATSTSPLSASPRTCVAMNTSARCLVGTTTTARTVPPMP